jgi:acetyl-CoA carboxylase alpha subunit
MNMRRFNNMTRLLTITTCLLSLVLLVSGCRHIDETTAEKKAVFIIVDGISADILEKTDTPNIDRIIAEHDDAADEPDDFCRRTGQVLQFELVRLLEDDPAARRTARHHRYRSLGR